MKRIEEINGVADDYDLIIVGAGPAGLAAASKASELGLATLLADENLTPGGQIYRAITTTPVKRRDVLGDAYWEGLELAEALDASGCDYSPQTVVWSVEPSRDDAGKVLEPLRFDIGISRGGMAKMIHAKHLILATGALERPFPVPGWTLPGVMTAGAAQIALKSSGLVPQGRIVLAGSGPLLLLLSDQLKRAGAHIVSVLDTTPAGNLTSAFSLLPNFLSSSYATYGLKLLVKTAFSLPIRRNVENLEITGKENVERVVYTRRGRRETIDCDQVMLHQGVIPNINMANALGCAQHWDAAVHAWTPTVDEWFTSSVPGISIAGDGAGIAGASTAACRGRIAAIAAACSLGQLSVAERERMSAGLRSQGKRLTQGRAFIDRLYHPAQNALRPRDPSAIICRCEEVRAGQIREVVRQLGVQGPNQLKAYLRTGMGPCQGRMCGPSVIELIAEQRGVATPEVGYFRLRMPIKPVTLEEIGSMPQNQAAKNAVMR